MSIWIASAVALMMLVASGWWIGRIMMAESDALSPAVPVSLTGIDAASALIIRISDACVALGGPRLTLAEDAGEFSLSIRQSSAGFRVSIQPRQLTPQTCALLTVSSDRVDDDDAVQVAALLVALHTRPLRRTIRDAVLAHPLAPWERRYLDAWQMLDAAAARCPSSRTLPALRDALALCPQDQRQSRIVMLGNLSHVCAALAEGTQVPLPRRLEGLDAARDALRAQAVLPIHQHVQGLRDLLRQLRAAI
ncbi:MAG: hypothetical protein AAGJ70_08025 [Pseudomonadota bacterium]